MTSYETLVDPDLSATDLPGWCLRYVQKLVGAPAWFRSAWEAWLNAPGRHGTHEPLPDAPCMVWFAHYGQYGDPPRYDNWGHVVFYAPGDAFYSSPASGDEPSFARLGSIADVEATYNAIYVGWSEGLHNVTIIRPKGFLMALSDKQQTELYNKTLAIHSALFKTTATSLTPQFKGGGVLKLLGALYDGMFKTTPTSLGTPGGVLETQRVQLDQLDELRDAFNDTDVDRARE